MAEKHLVRYSKANPEDFEFENFHWVSKSPPAKGPRRICKFCLLCVCLPILFLTVPLYMRFLALRPHQFTLSPADMKLLNHQSTVSTAWCSAQTISMNSSFNAYLLPEKPKIKRKRQRILMERRMVLEDDMKEYWGFYLLAGSIFRVQTCSRHEGASIVIVKGSKDAARCSWIGELDSQEESDELSNEFDIENEMLDRIPAVETTSEEIIEEESEEIQAYDTKEISDDIKMKSIISDSSKEASKYLNNIGQWSVNSQKILVKKLMQNLKRKDEGKPENNTMPLSLSGYVEEKGIDKNEKDMDIELLEDKAIEDYEDTEGEDLFEDTDHMFNRGRFNQQNLPTDKEDKSDEETYSSWSSSEEALEACEGVIHNKQLLGRLKCGENTTEEELQSVMTEFSHMVESSGFYYFIFSNDNEITPNFIAAHFELQKTVFDVDDYQEKCLNSTSCSLPLSFMSTQHVVVEVPASDSDTCEYEAEGFTNYHNCHAVLRAESICEPRGAVYLIFLLLVPVLVLMFASI